MFSVTPKDTSVFISNSIHIICALQKDVHFIHNFTFIF